MPKGKKVSTEEKIRVVELCLRGRMCISEAAQLTGVDCKSVSRWISRYRAEGPSALAPSLGWRRYSPELKLSAVQEYLSTGLSQQAICEKYQIRTTSRLNDWIKVYTRHEDFKKRSGGSRMTKARKTSQEERIKIVRECLAAGKDYGGIAQKYAVSYQQVYTWVKKFEEKGEAGLEDRRGQRTRQQEPRTAEEEYKARIAQLEHELYMTRMERDLLKKVKELERRDRWGK